MRIKEQSPAGFQALRMAKMGHYQLINQLESELYRCSRDHGDCQECQKRKVCLMEYDELVSLEKLNQENVEKFLEKVGQ